MNTKIRLALAQTNTVVGDFEENCKKILQYVEKAKQAGAEIVLFPELTIPSYFPEDLLLKKKFVEANRKHLEILADEIKGVLAIVGLVGRNDSGSEIYNSAAIIQDQKVVTTYNKICLPNYSVFDEKRYFTPGNRPLVFEFNEIKFGLNVCEDIWVPDGVTECQGFTGGAEVILSISASPYYVAKREVRLDLGIERATKTRALVAYLNLVGGQDELVFDGDSFVVDHEGKLLTRCHQFEEDFAVIDLDVGKVREFRAKDSNFQKEVEKFVPKFEPEFLRIQDFETNSKPEIGPRIAEPLTGEAEVYKALNLGTHDYVNKNEFKKVVIGLSGGIDSALTAAIAVDALGAANVFGVLMPSEITSQASVDDALTLAKNLDIETTTIAIKPAFDAYNEMLSDIFTNLPTDTTEENLQARIRGNILMALSNKF